IDDYQMFLRAKALPEYDVEFDPLTEHYRITAPSRFASWLGVEAPEVDESDLPFNEKLFDDQEAIVRMALEAKRFAVWSDCGLGKGLQPDCPVLTPTGYRALSELKVGDQVIGSNGKSTEIVGYFP